MSRARCAVVLCALSLVAGCGRHVVVDPETADRRNERVWRVTSEPNRAPPATPPSAPPP